MADIQQFKKITAIVTAICLSISLVSCTAKQNSEPPFAARFNVQGDVKTAYLFTGKEDFEYYDITDDGNKYSAVSLAQIIEKSQPVTEDYTLLLIGRDGLTSEIDGKDLSGCHITYTDDLGWQHITEFHPISSRVKLLDKIVVVAKETELVGASFAGNTKSSSYTAGSIYKSYFGSELQKSGTSEINGRYVSVYTKNITAELSQLMDFDKTVAIFTKEGKTIFDRPSENSKVVFEASSISYIKSTDEKVENIAGILADPPLLSITEAYNDALAALEAGNRVMVVEIDGWGRSIADYARENGGSTFLNGIEQQTLLSVYPFVSTAGLAAIITGKTGDENGIISREHKELMVEDIFSKAEKLGKKSSYIEGSLGLIKTSLSPTLSVDKKGQKDVGVFENTKAAIASQSDFIYTHFHSVDDVATTYGPHTTETLDQLNVVDKMVEELVKSFDGTVIITADHGLHTTNDGGYHGIVSKHDSLVPYIIIKGDRDE